ncbi:glycerophosphodiester phosphodiesterase [Persicimonas caeni]|uniref:Glycerophosphodiester phosphodiesterase n=1 Tax=Persicimonas caeni TaxID=2292766 RepID=A0A4Y6PVX0_PERCE|nr:glycerophosphodiester phosphodiesterase family protein [Persicimonas caeni]QDG52393.1 glycerophosphodiester phosphodiesterase [Persicimonas caeni]QED33615.1 glycerophosphodiester phosphodiesterase [Persicimonas caeni]
MKQYLVAIFAMSSMVGVGCSSAPATQEVSAVQDPERAQNTDKPLDIQGHRGARGLKPENTLPAFEAALDLQVDTLEFDLHLSKDDRLVVWHDPFVSAKKCVVPDGVDDLPDPAALRAKDARLRVRNLTADQLARYRCTQNPDPKRFPAQDASPTALAGDDYGIVTLERVFAFVERYAQSPQKTDGQRDNARRVRFNIETKRKPRQPANIGDGFDGERPGTFERAFVEAVEARGLQDRVTLQSFDHRSLWAARTIAPWLELAALEKKRRGPLAALADKGAAVWSPRHTLVTAKSVAEAHAAGLRVKPWTVNDAERMQALVDLGVDGIITDRPDLAGDL